MPRGVIIGVLIVLIVGVVGGTTILIISRLSNSSPTSSAPTTSSLPTANTGSQQVEDPNGDSDLDGLSNADELLWGTSSLSADTDNDGYKDGEEVKASHNPTIASPNDKLPAGFQPGQNRALLSGSAPATQSFESFFSESVDVTGGKKNLTQEYTNTVSDKDKSPESLSAYISSRPIITTLPKLNDAAIQIQPSSPHGLSSYLEVAGNIDPLVDTTRMTMALRDLLNSQDPTGFRVYAEKIATYKTSIIALTVPPEALAYHKILVGYTELLGGTLGQIAAYNTDQVKAFVALRQLDAIDTQYSSIILQERAKLMKLIPS